MATVAVYIAPSFGTCPGEELHPRVGHERDSHALGARCPYEESRGRAPQAIRDLERLEHHCRWVIRCDQEALRSVVSEAARLWSDASTIPEHLAAGDWRGSGFIEPAVKTVEEVVRTRKLDVEARISQNLNITHRPTPCLVEHAIDLVNKLRVGQL